MKVYIGLDTGIGKAECEDTAFVNEHLADGAVTEWVCDGLRCIGVADGVGGNPGGRLASTYAASRIIRADFSGMSEASIRQFAAELNGDIIQYAAGIPGKTKMATTLTCLVAADDGFYMLHAGNTRLYAMQGAYLKQLTTDHTTRDWLIQLGQFEAADRCSGSEINCCFGGGDMRYLDRIVVETLFKDGIPGTLLLTSDGIHEFVDVDTMEQIMQDASEEPEAIRMLMEYARANGSKDDQTVVIVRR